MNNFLPAVFLFGNILMSLLYLRDFANHLIDYNRDKNKEEGDSSSFVNWTIFMATLWALFYFVINK